MIHDLVGQGDLSRSCDVLVIGGGTAGLVIANFLARSGVSTICLESGGLQQAEESHPLNEVVQTGTPYAGAERGRFRCLGGTSTRWGGALIPFAAADLDAARWPLSMNDLAVWVQEVEKVFKLTPGPYEDDLLQDGTDTFCSRQAKWPAFKNRNVFNLLFNETSSERGPTIWLNATAEKFSVDGGELREVCAKAPDGSSLTIRAKDVVLAAGAIESTRILLLIDKQNGNLVSEASPSLGKYFHDHLSCTVAKLEVTDRRALNRMVGFRFESAGTMRNVRFELKNTAKVRGGVVPCFAHVAFEDAGGPFGALRDCYRALQQRTFPSPALLGRLASGTPWLARAVWWRFVEKRLLYPSDAAIQVVMVIEQNPVPENRITLSPDRVDRFGQPLAQINWSVTEIDRENMRRAINAFERSWSFSALSKVAKFTRMPAAQIDSALSQDGGIFHPGGSTRMAHTARDGVVDKDLRVFSIRNLRVVATSVLPTGGGANPTMMLLALALRCVADISRQLGKHAAPTA